MSAIDVIVPTGDTHAIANPSPYRKPSVMRALTLVAERQLAIAQMPAPPVIVLKRMESRQASGTIVIGL
jgi:hypothetical protein